MTHHFRIEVWKTHVKRVEGTEPAPGRNLNEYVARSKGSFGQCSWCVKKNRVRLRLQLILFWKARNLIKTLEQDTSVSIPGKSKLNLHFLEYSIPLSCCNQST